MITLALFENTGACRVFDSFNVAAETYSISALYTRPAHVKERVSNLIATAERVYYWLKGRGEPVAPPPDSDDADVLAEWIFQNATQYGNKVFKNPAAKEKAGYRIDLAKAEENVGNTEVPKQVRQLCAFLAEQRFDFYTKKELRGMTNLYSYVKHVKTKQDPWRIWRYYTPTLQKLGVIK